MALLVKELFVRGSEVIFQGPESQRTVFKGQFKVMAEANSQFTILKSVTGSQHLTVTEKV